MSESQTESDARRWPHQQCVRTEPHDGHTHVNEGPRGGCGLPEWCPGITVSPPVEPDCPHGKRSPLNCGLCAGVDG